ncbi:hypothetical protein DUNSADRAFT_9350 [Dunaliella salina]|nr:hypothetical protein DUNSADRAFT_9350 [Dunaliella salina]|eukprot:KAF5842090.1 hypothetical protein DUNSADRAFT_9350 [Dunaliella salina]
MGMPHPERAPMILVDRHTLNEYSGREGKDTGSGPATHVQGLCLATVYSSVPSIVRTPGSLLGVSSISTPIVNKRCNVSAVLVLYGLPRLFTGCILAHELMHAWLRMKNITGLNLKVEEGLCQLMAYVWLDRQHGKLSKDALQQRYASYFSYQIRTDISDVYGNGFRDAYEAFEMRGLTAVINDVLSRGRFA